MKDSHIGFGLFLISIGTVLFLVNTGVISWSIIDGLLELWPAIFIVIGINIIFKNNSVVRIVTWLLFLAAIVSYGYFFQGRESWVFTTGRIQPVLVQIQTWTELKNIML